MSPQGLWKLSLPLAVLGWAGLALVTAFLPPSTLGMALALPLLALALIFTAALLIWGVASRLRLGDVGQRPALALRLGTWIGLWLTAAAGLRLIGQLTAVVALGLAVGFGLVEFFLRGLARQQADLPGRTHEKL